MRKLSKSTDKARFITTIENSGLHGMHYIDLVDDYMTLFDAKNKLAREMKRMDL